MKKLYGALIVTFCLTAVAPQCYSVELDADTALWNEVKSTNLIEDYQAYISQFPKGKFVALAKNRINKLQAGSDAKIQKKSQEAAPTHELGVLPQLPFDISEDVLETLKAADAYRNLPQPKTIKVSYQSQANLEHTGAKSSKLPKGSFSETVTNEITPFGNKCMVKKNILNQIQNVEGLPSNQNGLESVSYQCGLVSLGYVANGKPTLLVKKLKLEGSLFPLAIGAEQNSVATNYMPSAPSIEQTQSKKCRVESKGPAHAIDPRLTGVAWKVRCESGVQISGAFPINVLNLVEDYFLADLGVFLSDIGQGDSLTPQGGTLVTKLVLPSPGSQTTIIATGDYGSRTTRTYQSYDLSVGK